MLFPSFTLEKELWKQGYKYVCGLDEVGRGSFAGPVVVGAVIFPQNIVLPKGITDSKLLKPHIREKLAGQIRDQALAWAIGEIGVGDINKHGIGKATQMAFRKAVKLLSPKAEFILVDAFFVRHFCRKKQKAVAGGDRISTTIAAASIIAKVYRDQLMCKLHQSYPQYDFYKHKGYGTAQHREAIKKYGLCEIHRRSFNLTRYE